MIVLAHQIVRDEVVVEAEAAVAEAVVDMEVVVVEEVEAVVLDEEMMTEAEEVEDKKQTLKQKNSDLVGVFFVLNQSVYLSA
jgi:hypothetical protein